jgi:hypothetical protein
MNKFVFGVCTLAELVGISLITGIALKRNNDCYKAEIKCIDVEHELLLAELKGVAKDCEIARLKKELEEAKK